MGSSSPFQFFTYHPEPELASATAEGRKAEFADHGWDADESRILKTRDFVRSKLNWDEPDVGEHARLWQVYQALTRCATPNPASPTRGSNTFP